MITYFAYDHQDKGVPFTRALASRGWSRVPSVAAASLILTDLHTFGREGLIEREWTMRRTGAVLYPHAPDASYTWNFPGAQWSPFVVAVLVPSSGFTQIMRSYGCPFDTIVTGWPYNIVRGFVPHPGGAHHLNVLYGPIHPNSNGFLSSVDRNQNARAFQYLLNMKHSGVISNLTVRHVRGLIQNGLWAEKGVHYEEVVPSIEWTLQELPKYDLVVGRQTLACLGVSLGIPTIMMGQWIAPHYGQSEAKLVYVSDWAKYRHLLAFPLDILAETDTEFLIERALYSDYEIADWKTRMIGGQFNTNWIATLENFLNGIPIRREEKEKEPETQYEWVNPIQERV